MLFVRSDLIYFRMTRKFHLSYFLTAVNESFPYIFDFRKDYILQHEEKIVFLSIRHQEKNIFLIPKSERWHFRWKILERIKFHFLDLEKRIFSVCLKMERMIFHAVNAWNLFITRLWRYPEGLQLAHSCGLVRKGVFRSFWAPRQAL